LNEAQRWNGLNVLNFQPKDAKSAEREVAGCVGKGTFLSIFGRVLELLDAADAEVGVNAGRRAK
jgi:hypothetical protein